ncbi:MAG: tRNA (adenosine(37)-N6)-threonylcarbamoyltransferase complex ATPase subunit type 1 TsaE [Pedobacter sp.]|nr:MAG: tRNA (adenosine(37)-N6)-threonylcarbamoyltransferase complex ATPase subunit type 1 TsaE [Pedobacter sp.]
MQIIINTITQLSAAAKQLLASYKRERIFLFFGDMGVGKTTFIKSICDQLGVCDVVSSPTYSIVNEYASKDGLVVYHFDFYRLKSETEALDLGFEEYLDSGSYCFIEWPEKISSYWPKRYVKVELTISGGRTICAALEQA